MPRDDLDRLLATVRQDRPADQAWPAAAAAIEVLWWHERFADARALAEDTIHRFREAPESLFANDFPFDEAVLIGAAESDDDPATALMRVSERVPARSVLGTRLTWLVQKLPERPPHSLVTGIDTDQYNPLPAKPLSPAQAELVQRDSASLTAEEQRKLWVAVQRCHQPAIAVRLYDDGVRPRDWHTWFWLARQLVKAGRTTDATAVLIESLDLWFSEDPWHVTPNGIMLQPDMRTAITPALRDAVLNNVDVASVPGVQT